MPLTNTGIQAMTNLTTGEAETAFNNANAYLGVGTSSTAFAKTQTDLIGTDFRQGMEATYPSVSSLVATYRSLFATGDANFAWEEWGLFNNATVGTMLVRETTSLGTKTAAQSWQLTVDVTFSNP